MRLTKPAGCAMQLLSLPFMFGGCVMAAKGFGPVGDLGSGVLGLVLMVAGTSLLVIGRQPATRQ